MRIRVDWKSFWIGCGALFVGLILPTIGNTMIGLVSKVRDSLPWSKKK